MTLLLMTARSIDLPGSSTAKPEMSSTDCNRMASGNGKRMVQAGASDLADKISDSVLSLLDIAGYNYAQSHGCGRLLSFGSESAKNGRIRRGIAARRISGEVSLPFTWRALF